MMQGGQWWIFLFYHLVRNECAMRDYMCLLCSLDVNVKLIEANIGALYSDM